MLLSVIWEKIDRVLAVTLLVSLAVIQPAAAPVGASASTGEPADVVSVYSDKSLERVVTLQHKVPIGAGRFMKVQEQFTLKSWLRWPHRGILMISSTAFNRTTFSTPVEGYNATEMLAKMGMFVLTLDYIGVGDSYHPDDGRDASREATIAAMNRVIHFFRTVRQIPKLDILAEGYGSTMAPYLAADSSSVRTLVMSSTIYKFLNDGPLTDPGFVAMITDDEDGYILIPPEAYDGVMPEAPPEVLEYQRTTQSGFYPVSLFPVGLEFPFYDPGVARVPGLIIYGLDDTFAGPGDPEALAADYGTEGAELVYLEAAGHAPRVEEPETAARFWEEVIRFIEP